MLQAIAFIIFAVAIAAGVGEGCSGGPKADKSASEAAPAEQAPTEASPENSAAEDSDVQSDVTDDSSAEDGTDITVGENPEPAPTEPEPEQPTPQPEEPTVVPPAAPELSVSRQGDNLHYRWPSVSDAQSYTLYYARESFGNINSLSDYANLDGAGRISGISATETILQDVERGIYWFAVITASKTENSTVTESAPSEEVQWMIGTKPLNDTGLIVCNGFDPDDSGWVNPGGCIATSATATTAGVYDDADQTPVPAGLALHSGRDALAVAGALPKTGAGSAGFDFTRLASDGTVYSGSGDFGTEPWDCVLDHTTGLAWEVKTTSGLHRDQSVFSWYNPDNASNGGISGSDDVTQNCTGYQSGNSGTYCNTDAFIIRTNNEALCGFSDWRLPTVEELLGILKLNPDLTPAVDSRYFPNAGPGAYWTSAPAAGQSGSSWAVEFFAQRLNAHAHASAHSIRLVRGN